MLTDVIVDVDTLTMIYDEELKRTDPVPTAGQSNPYSVGVSGGSPFTLSDIRAGVGPNANQVTITLEPPAEAGQRIGLALFREPRHHRQQGAGPRRQRRRRVQ